MPQTCVRETVGPTGVLGTIMGAIRVKFRSVGGGRPVPLPIYRRVSSRIEAPDPKSIHARGCRWRSSNHSIKKRTGVKQKSRQSMPTTKQEYSSSSNSNTRRLFIVLHLPPVFVCLRIRARPARLRREKPPLLRLDLRRHAPGNWQRNWLSAVVLAELNLYALLHGLA